MKKLLLLTTITIFGFVNAQTKKENIRVTYATEFIIDYEKIKDNIPADYRAAFKAEIDKGIVVNFRLESNGEKSVFRPEEKVNNAQDEGGMLAQEIMASESNPLYKDYVNNEFINVREFGGKTFLVKDKLPDYQWKLTKEKSVTDEEFMTEVKVLQDKYKEMNQGVDVSK